MAGERLIIVNIDFGEKPQAARTARAFGHIRAKSNAGLFRKSRV
jgi:hypothetical protein